MMSWSFLLRMKRLRLFRAWEWGISSSCMPTLILEASIFAISIHRYLLDPSLAGYRVEEVREMYNSTSRLDVSGLKMYQQCK